MRASVRACVCVRASKKGEAERQSGADTAVDPCALCHFHSMSMSNWRGLILPRNPFYMVSKVTASVVFVVGQTETCQALSLSISLSLSPAHTHAQTKTARWQTRRSPKSPLISSRLLAANPLIKAEPRHEPKESYLQEPYGGLNVEGGPR